jgi:hypothetical protein
MQYESILFFQVYPWIWTETWRSWSKWHRIWCIFSRMALWWTHPTHTLLPFRKCISHAGSNCQRRGSFPEDAKTLLLHRGCQHVLGWTVWIGKERWRRWSFWWFNISAVKNRIFWSLGTWLHRLFFPLRIFREFGRTLQLLEKALISSSFSLSASAFSVTFESDRGLLIRVRPTIPWNVVWAIFRSWICLHWWIRC